MRSCAIKAPAALAPLSWCMTTLSSWIAWSTRPVPVSATVAPVRLIVRMPGRSSLGAVRLPASAAFALPTARKHSHRGSRPSSTAFLMSSRRRVRTRSESIAPVVTAPSYLSRACKNLLRHASRSALRRGAPDVDFRMAPRTSSSCAGASPRTSAQLSVLNIGCVSGKYFEPSQMRSHLRHLSICACKRPILVPCWGPVLLLTSCMSVTRPLSAPSMAPSLRAGSPNDPIPL